ncbi:MAG TPA: hypothetical protein VM262_13135 [Acidimicrobiales bacterium]|nr:hypothetical protein [Acidimicrobiales bacterium]
MRLADECEAYLAGRLVEALRHHGTFAPVWTWLNEAAHAGETQIRQRAEKSLPVDADVETRTRSAVARAVLGALGQRELHVLQRDLLVPLELRLAVAELSPRRLIELVGRALYL